MLTSVPACLLHGMHRPDLPLLIRVWAPSLSKEVAQQSTHCCGDHGQPLATAPVFRIRSGSIRPGSKPSIKRRKLRRGSSRVRQEIRTSRSPSSVQGAREVAGECTLRWCRQSRRWSRGRSPSCGGPAGRCGAASTNACSQRAHTCR